MVFLIWEQICSLEHWFIIVDWYSVGKRFASFFFFFFGKRMHQILLLPWQFVAFLLFVLLLLLRQSILLQILDAVSDFNYHTQPTVVFKLNFLCGDSNQAYHQRKMYVLWYIIELILLLRAQILTLYLFYLFISSTNCSSNMFSSSARMCHYLLFHFFLLFHQQSVCWTLLLCKDIFRYHHEIVYIFFILTLYPTIWIYKILSKNHIITVSTLTVAYILLRLLFQPFFKIIGAISEHNNGLVYYTPFIVRIFIMFGMFIQN